MAFVLLAVVLPAGFAAALSARPARLSPPALDGLPTARHAQDPLPPSLAPESTPRFEGEHGFLPVVVTGLGRAGAAIVVSLEVTGAFRHPDPLVYVSAAGARSGAPLPEDARFLGSLGPHATTAFAWPASHPVGGTQLLLYSLAHQQVVGTVRLPAVEEPGP